MKKLGNATTVLLCEAHPHRMERRESYLKIDQDRWFKPRTCALWGQSDIRANYGEEVCTRPSGCTQGLDEQSRTASLLVNHRKMRKAVVFSVGRTHGLLLVSYSIKCAVRLCPVAIATMGASTKQSTM